MSKGNHSRLRPQILSGLAMMVSFGAFVNIQYNPLLFRLRELGKWEVGVALALGNLASLFSPLLAGWWTDRSRRPRLVLALHLGAAAIGLAFLPHLRGMLPILAGFFAIQVAMSPVAPLSQTLVLSATGTGAGGFLAIRTMGTLGFLLVSIWLSRCLTGWSLEGAYLAMGGLFLLSIPFYLALPADPSAAPPLRDLRLGQVLSMIWDPRLRLLYLGCGIGYFCNALGVAAIPHLVTGPLGRPDADISTAWSVATAFEMVFMLLSIPFVRRFGLRRFILLGLGATSLRWAAAAAAGDYGWFLAAQSLHGLMVAGIFTGQNLALARMVPPERLASATAAAALLNGGVMSVAGSLVSGIVWNCAGLAAVCWLTALVALGGYILYHVAGPDPDRPD